MNELVGNTDFTRVKTSTLVNNGSLKERKEIQRENNMTTDITISVSDKDGIQTVSARELHEKLGSNERFSKWWERFSSYGFIENVDFVVCTKKYTANQYGGEKEVDDYAITIEMAKQICMLQRNEKGKQYREYFIRLEKAWNTPEAIFARALQMADKTLAEAKRKIDIQQMQIEDMRPKAEFFDDVTGSSDTMDMKEVAKVLNLGMGRNSIFNILRQKGILDRNNQPYQKFVDRGYFRIVESKYTMPTGEIRISLKTVVFQSGLDFIRRIIRGGAK